MELTSTPMAGFFGGSPNNIPPVFQSPVESSNRNAIGTSHVRRKRSVRQHGAHSLWDRQRCILHRHPSVDSLPDLGGADFGDFVNHPSIGKSGVVPFVPGLLAQTHPAAVAWLIVAIAVDPVNRQLVRIPVADGPELERFIALNPLFADSYPAPAIVFPAAVVWVGASVQHPVPDAKQSCFRVSVRRHIFARKTRCKAAARLCVAAAKVASKHCHQHPAGACASPPRASVLCVLGAPQDAESLKNSAGEVVGRFENMHRQILRKRKGGWA